MTIKDVAQEAGVSVSTVSRVINSGDTSAASPETQKKIWEAARELGYVPNQSARQLRKPKSQAPQNVQRIDCIFARVIGTNIDYFFEQIMYEIQSELLKHGSQMSGIYTLQNLGNSGMQHNCSNAAVVLGRLDEEQLLILKRHYSHIVTISLQDRDLSVDQVISRGYDAVVNSVKYLHSLGHKQICYLGETVHEQRYDAYLDIMETIGVSNPESLVVEAAFSPASGYNAVQQLLERGNPFTAILCANDVLALGVIKALNDHHLRVPRDVSIIGINDKEDVRYLDPMLTAVNIPIKEMGKHATKLLLDRIAGGHQLPVKLLLPNKLNVRESCGPVGTGQSKQR